MIACRIVHPYTCMDTRASGSSCESSCSFMSICAHKYNRYMHRKYACILDLADMTLHKRFAPHSHIVIKSGAPDCNLYVRLDFIDP